MLFTTVASELGLGKSRKNLFPFPGKKYHHFPGISGIFFAIFWHILTLFSHILTLFRTFKLFWSMNFKIFFQFHHFMCFEL